MSSNDDNGWFVYMIRCDDDRLYTGITTDMVRRWREHSGVHQRDVRQNEEMRVGDVDRCSSGRCKEGVSAAETVRSPNRGAKFFRGRKPLQLAYIESGHDRSSASRREAAIKRLPRAAKLQLLTADHNELHTLDRALLPIIDSSRRS
ncbi:MAG: GIY-YIG nuclease family protein [Spongiibacteraceae bacterium]